MTLRDWFSSIAGSAPSPKWVAVLDTSVLVPAAMHNQGVNAKVVRAAIAELYECVLSEYIRLETREVLSRPEIDIAVAETDRRFQDLWVGSWILDPVPASDPRLLRVVKGDVKDLPVLATGLAIFAVPELAALPRKFLVSNNTTDFTPGQILYGLEFITGQAFWRRLEQGAGAKMPRSTVPPTP